jgi:hypothetical protein
VLRRVKAGPRRASEDTKFLQGGSFAGAHACRVYLPVFALVDLWWTRADGRPRRPPHRDRPDGNQPRSDALQVDVGPSSTSVNLTADAPFFQRSGFGLFAEFSCMRGSHCMRGAARRSAPADGEDRSMAQTDQAWDWGVELRDEERSELELLRRTVAQLRTQLDQAHESLRSCRQRQQDASEALRQLDEARPWRRRRVRRALRERQLL